MTSRQISNMQDILDALEASPELRRDFHRHMVKAFQADAELRQDLRKEILTEELLQLPVRFTKTEQDITEIKGRLDSLEQNQETIIAEQRTMANDISELKASQSAMTADIGELKANQSTMATNQSTMAAEQRTMSGRIAHLMGNDYESRAIEQSRRLVRDHLDMLEADVMHASAWNSQQIDKSVFVEPARVGLITRAEARQLEAVDCIIRCQDEAGNIVHAAVETSVAVRDGDRRHAIERAAILAKITGTAVQPFVVGQTLEATSDHFAAATFLEYAGPEHA